MIAAPLVRRVTMIVLLCTAGLVAGVMNAIAGGGTFAVFPALLAAGLQPTVANATSATALLPGAAASAWTYRRSLRMFGPLSLRAMFVLTVLGGSVGALLLYFKDQATFRAIVPWLLLVASLTLTFAGAIRRRLERTHWTVGAPGAATLQLVISIYGGYFGGAVGLIMMASWVLISDLPAKDLARRAPCS